MNLLDQYKINKENIPKIQTRGMAGPNKRVNPITFKAIAYITSISIA
jgi:hypothetical protein